MRLLILFHTFGTVAFKIYFHTLIERSETLLKAQIEYIKTHETNMKGEKNVIRIK